MGGIGPCSLFGLYVRADLFEDRWEEDENRSFSVVHIGIMSFYLFFFSPVSCFSIWVW